MKETRFPVAVVGASGFVGAHLVAVLGGRSAVVAIRASGRPPADVAAEVIPLRAGSVVNAAAMASVAACEGDPSGAARANSELPGLLADAACAADSRFVHLSTDQVFDGRRGRYVESDPPSPRSVYGETKLDGERRVLERDPSALVVRLNLLYGSSATDRPSGTDRLIDRARRGEPVTLFTDEFRSPLFVAEAAAALAALLPAEVSGVLHLGGPERTSRYALGAAILAANGLEGRARPASIASHAGPPRTPDTSFDSRLAFRLLARPPRAPREVFART